MYQYFIPLYCLSIVWNSVLWLFYLHMFIQMIVLVFFILLVFSFMFNSPLVVQSLSHVWLFATHELLQHAKLPCPLLSPRVCSSSCTLSQWCYLTISFSPALFSFCLQSFPALRSFPMSWLFASGGQSIGASALASFLPVNIQGWFPLGLISLIFLLSRGLSDSANSPLIQCKAPVICFFQFRCTVNFTFVLKFHLCLCMVWQLIPFIYLFGCTVS